MLLEILIITGIAMLVFILAWYIITRGILFGIFIGLWKWLKNFLVVAAVYVSGISVFKFLAIISLGTIIPSFDMIIVPWIAAWIKLNTGWTDPWPYYSAMALIIVCSITYLVVYLYTPLKDM